MSGPSEKAQRAATEAWITAGNIVGVLDAAHDPELGLDRSVCLRDVVQELRANYDAASPFHVFGLPPAAEFIERKFGGA